MVAPAMGKEPAPISLADFFFDPNDEILACPMGQIPQRLKVGKKRRFHRPLRQSAVRCLSPAIRLPSSTREKTHDPALRRQGATPGPAPRQGKDGRVPWVYRYRAGAEATMSDLDRVTGIKHLRATAFRCGKKRRRRAEGSRSRGYGLGMGTVKERFWCLLANFRSIFPLPWRKTGCQFVRAV